MGCGGGGVGGGVVVSEWVDGGCWERRRRCRMMFRARFS